MAPKTSRYITVGIGNSMISIPIFNVVEIQEIDTITPLPQAPGWLKGVINLRGDILSVVDITSFLNLQNIALTPQTKLIVLTGSKYQTVILADNVLEVVTIKDDDIDPVRENMGESSKLISGVYSSEEDLFTILDVESFMNDDRMLQFQ